MRSDGVAPPLDLKLFGPFRACVNGASLPRLRSRKGHALLALLALRDGRSLDRTWLAGTLWPDSAHPQALANLRNTLKDLRLALGPEAARFLSPTTRSLMLDLAGAEVDVLAFDAAIARGDLPSLEQAVALYVGPLLEGCEEEWVAEERQAREQAYLAALEALADDARTRGDLRVAERALRRVVATDPLRESAQRALIETLAAGGSDAAALQVYRELRELLHRELNAEPARDTQALFQQLRSAARERAQRPRPMLPGATVDTPPNNLPHQLTCLIGRERELAEVSHRLNAHRLVTLTGAGGCGKTRLALEVAAGRVGAFPHGVFFVNLAPIRDPDLVASTIAQTLEVRESAGRPLVGSLKEYLREKQLLLLLDNFEQVLAAAPFVAELLASAGRLTVLVTSRAALRVRGEQEYEVPPLALPESADRLSAESLSQCAAVALFADRAAGVQAGFAVTPENATAVAQICCRLDGLPLAIELAAARVKLFPPQALLARLGNRLELLTEGPRDLPARQQTLRSAIGWSYDLLEEAEQRLFRRLSVFVGGFTLNAAEALCQDEGDPCAAVLNGAASLVDKNLLKPLGGEAEKPRFGMLETIREYGRECLAASGEEESIRGRHAHFFLDWVEAANTPSSGPRGASYLNTLEREHDNLRAVLAWALEKSSLPDGAEAADVGLRLGAAVSWLWISRSHQSEGERWLTSLLASPHAALQTKARARALFALASQVWALGDREQAQALCEDSLALARELGDRPGIADALGFLGQMNMNLDRPATARPLLEEGLVLYRELQDCLGIGYLLNELGGLAYRTGDLDTACRHWEEGAEFCRAMGDGPGLFAHLHHLAVLARARDENEIARRLHLECLTISHDLRSRDRIASALSGLGWVAYEQGNLDLASDYWEEELAISREQEYRSVGPLNRLGRLARSRGEWAAARAFHEEALTVAREQSRKDITRNESIASALLGLAEVACAEHDLSGARLAYRESLAFWKQMRWEGAPKFGPRARIVRCLNGLAEVAVREGQAARAARGLGATVSAREMLGVRLLPPEAPAWERCVAEVRAALGEDAFGEGWEAGRKMTLEEAIDEALLEE